MPSAADPWRTHPRALPRCGRYGRCRTVHEGRRAGVPSTGDPAPCVPSMRHQMAPSGSRRGSFRPGGAGRASRAWQRYPLTREPTPCEALHCGRYLPSRFAQRHLCRFRKRPEFWPTSKCSWKPPPPIPTSPVPERHRPRSRRSNRSHGHCCASPRRQPSRTCRWPFQRRRQGRLVSVSRRPEDAFRMYGTPPGGYLTTSRPPTHRRCRRLQSSARSR